MTIVAETFVELMSEVGNVQSQSNTNQADNLYFILSQTLFLKSAKHTYRSS